MEKKLVIVDDAPFIREVVRHIIDVSEFSVIGEAENGQQAVDMVAELQPNIVLMDIVMPVRSGIDATEEIVKRFPHIKVIACSTEGQETMVMRAIEAGCSNFVVKPFTAQQLLSALRAAASTAVIEDEQVEDKDEAGDTNE